MAMSEMQKAVTLAERRALDSVASERIKMERLLMEAASVSGTSTSISSTSTAAASTTRNPNMSVLDIAISAEGLNKNNKMISDNAKENHEDDFEVGLLEWGDDLGYEVGILKLHEIGDHTGLDMDVHLILDAEISLLDGFDENSAEIDRLRIDKDLHEILSAKWFLDISLNIPV